MVQALKSLVLCPLLLACSYTTNVYQVDDAGPNDAAISDTYVAEPDVDANVDPNAWVYQQIDLSTKFANCTHLVGDAGAATLATAYYFDSSTYHLAQVFYACSVYLTPTCDLQKTLVNASAYYSYPAPTPKTIPNALAANCQLTAYNDPGGTYAMGETMEWYSAGYAPAQVISDCQGVGGTLYAMWMLLYDSDFQVMVDQHSATDTLYSCY